MELEGQPEKTPIIWLKKIKKKTSLEPAAHLTCMGTSFDEIEKIAEDYWSTGVRHLVALRGDIPIQNEKIKKMILNMQLI